MKNFFKVRFSATQYCGFEDKITNVCSGKDRRKNRTRSSPVRRILNWSDGKSGAVVSKHRAFWGM
jgi:hypothetical protein